MGGVWSKYKANKHSCPNKVLLVFTSDAHILVSAPNVGFPSLIQRSHVWYVNGMWYGPFIFELLHHLGKSFASLG